MRDRGQVFIGAAIILAGLVFLIGNQFNINVWAFCWPTALILLGVWLLVRTQRGVPDTGVRQRLLILGDMHRDGAWQVADEEIWVGVGDVDLDMLEAEVPLGETRIRILGFVSDVDILVPEGVGVSVSSTAFVSDAKVLGKKREGILVPVDVVSDDYETAERKVRLETTCFVSEVKVRRV